MDFFSEKIHQFAKPCIIVPFNQEGSKNVTLRDLKHFCYFSKGQSV